MRLTFVVMLIVYIYRNIYRPSEQYISGRIARVTYHGTAQHVYENTINAHHLLTDLSNLAN